MKELSEAKKSLLLALADGKALLVAVHMAKITVKQSPVSIGSAEVQELLQLGLVHLSPATGGQFDGELTLSIDGEQLVRKLRSPKSS